MLVQDVIIKTVWQNWRSKWIRQLRRNLISSLYLGLGLTIEESIKILVELIELKHNNNNL